MFGDLDLLVKEMIGKVPSEHILPNGDGQWWFTIVQIRKSATKQTKETSFLMGRPKTLEKSTAGTKKSPNWKGKSSSIHLVSLGWKSPKWMILTENPWTRKAFCQQKIAQPSHPERQLIYPTKTTDAFVCFRFNRIVQDNLPTCKTNVPSFSKETWFCCF